MLRVVAVVLGLLVAAACSSDDGASSKVATSGCVPGASEACTGPAGCAGGQVCREDGSGYGPCDCGNVLDAGHDQHTDDAAADSADGSLDGSDAGDASGGCDPACGTDSQCCAGACVTLTAFDHCGACNTPCDPTLASACELDTVTGAATCRCGVFAACSSGTACVSSGGAMICTNLATDPGHCGAPNAACAEGEACVGGVCRCGGGAACGSGAACCGGACVDLQANGAHCGGCGLACATGENCSAGQCRCGSGPACTPPIGGFPPSLGQSCCNGACVQNSDASCNCTACDVANDEYCIAGGLLPGVPVEVCCSAALSCGGFPTP